MAADRKDVTCHDCERTYSRPEHLKRHQLSHSRKASHGCPHCKRPFKRRDVLSRHLRTCSHISAPSFASYDRACQRCSSKKRKCGHEKPTCKGCQEARHVCLYPIETSNKRVAIASPCLSDGVQSSGTESFETHRLLLELEEAEDLGMPHEEFFDIPNSRPQLAAPARHDFTMDIALQSFLPSLPPTTSFTFLIQFTARYSLKDCFSIINDVQTSSPSPQPSASENTWLELRSDMFDLSDWTNTVWSNSSGFEMSLMPNVEPRRQRLICDATPQTEDRLSYQMYMPKLSKTWAIFSAIQTVLSDWSEVHEGRCLDFFSPECISFALDVYWSTWHPNWPVIHRPTFSVEKTPIPLLAAMTVIGSCYSNLDNARYWFDAVEGLVFNDLRSTSNRQQSYRRIQSIQAAYLACIYQTWDGEETARTRIRRHRFNDIVTAARDLDMSSIKHDAPADFEDFDWVKFMHVEESIRTLLWVFLLDTAYVIFNNMPPHFALRELRMGLASCEACFQASSPRECFFTLRDWLAHNARPANLSLYGLINMFFTNRPSDAILSNLAHESFMNLWCVDAAFHVILFNLDPVLGGEQQFARLRVGIDTWEAVWNQRLRNNDEQFFDSIVTTAAFNFGAGTISESWKRPGFWKNAAEFWLLARVMLERMAAARESAKAADQLSGLYGLHMNVGPHIHDGIEDTDMRSLHSFLVVVGSIS